MTRRSFILASVGAPFLAGTFAPSLVFALLNGQWGTNLIWGFVFGLGWWVAQSIGGPENWRIAMGVGMLVWPSMVLTGLFLLSRTIWQSNSDRARRSFLLLITASCLPIVPAETVLALHKDTRVPPDFSALMASW